MLHLQATYNSIRTIVLTLVCCIFFSSVFAQSKEAARYEIDAKRIGVSPVDKDALPRSREFLRLDSTYYVGWMYEGIYKYDRSADYLGYRLAAVPLQKAFDLLEKDYGNNLKNIYSSFTYYGQHMNRMSDLYQIVYALQNCYNSIEMPDSTMALLDRLESYHFQKDYFGIYNERAWIYHRNRFFTSDKYKFLKNSVKENEDMAFRCCHYQLKLIQHNKEVNDYWYGPNQSKDDILSVEHNLALMHCYNKNYDSAKYYYRHLIEGNRVSWGNYANMNHEMGNIDSAIIYYSMPQNSREHALSEPDYYLPSIYIYGGRTKEAISMVQERIAANGSTPGFGWYNIALGRSYLYDAQLDSAAFYLDKAQNFKELHLHTTLTQSQYEFSINILRVQLLDKNIDQIKFQNKGWWYSFGDLYDIISLKIQKMQMEYVVVNELANNPERQRIIYDLFCGESTVTFDEVIFVLKDFSSPYFLSRCNYSIKNDKREPIKKYFKLFSSKLKLENGDDEDAAIETATLIKEINSPEYTVLDTANEKLFLARLYEVMAHTTDDDDTREECIHWENKFLEEFPQLVPYSGLRTRMKMTVAGNNDEITNEVIDNLKDCNIEWVETGNVPEANISITKARENYRVLFNVISASGKTIVQQGEMIFKKPEGAGEELALRLFSKGGNLKFEPVVEDPAKLP
ncbi:MAG: hypothetical protein K0S44_1123 [Bacteroidetes bacterium]|nr:hypothetical protein [Bacteroidota bacterium]